MYTAHYGLRIKPFQISSDVAFMWLGEKHKEALATLRYGILDNKGFLLLTGDVGTGKTTLINTLIGSLDEDVIYASVPDPSLDKLDFFNYISAAFGNEDDFDSKGKFLSGFSRFLNEAYENNKKVLLIIDECQLLTQELLEEIRLLSNIVTKDSNPLLNIFLVGQYEFNALIRRPENRAIAQRITLNYYIDPLTVAETGEYIRHRLKIAGTTEEIFNKAAVRAIYAFSEGFPRRINIICDHCMMSGYADDKKTITGSMVKDSANELQIPEHRRGEHHDVDIPAQPADISTSGISEQSSDQLDQPGQPSRLAQVFPVGNTMKVPFFRSIGGVFSIFLALIFFCFLFLYYTDTTYKEATAYLTSIQDKMGSSTLETSGNTVQPELQGKKVLPDNKDGLKSLSAPDSPLPVKTAITAEKKKQTVSATVTLSEKSKEENHSARLGKEDTEPVIPELTKTLPPEVEEENVEAVVVEQVNVQPVILAESMEKDSSDKYLEKPNLPLPKEALVIRFKHDSNLFSVADIERMKEFARVLKLHPGATVNISGYTDSTGDAVYNRRLSDFRAAMVKSFLMGQDLPPEQLRAQGFGNKNPVDRNDTEQGRMMNRRVEISAIVKK